MTSFASRHGALDSVAVAASALCLVHCLALPTLILLLPALAAYLSMPESFHEVALVIAIPSSALALALGHRRHRRRTPAFVAVPGLIALAVGAFLVPSEWLETGLSVFGATLVAAGHVLNWRASPNTPTHTCQST